MRAVIQRVLTAQVNVADQCVASIGGGLLLLLGISASDSEEESQWLLDKVTGLRIFPNSEGKFDRSILDVQGELLIVSQFTLLADIKKGRRPSFNDAALPDQANLIYERFVESARSRGVEVQTGQFGASMAVSLVNDGPVTIIVDSERDRRRA